MTRRSLDEWGAQGVLDSAAVSTGAVGGSFTRHHSMQGAGSGAFLTKTAVPQLCIVYTMSGAGKPPTVKPPKPGFPMARTRPSGGVGPVVNLLTEVLPGLR